LAGELGREDPVAKLRKRGDRPRFLDDRLQAGVGAKVTVDF